MSRRGFTLIETTVVLAIVAFMVVIALPNFQRWVADRRLRSAAAQVEGDLQIARLTAINRSAPVAVEFEDAPDGNGYRIFVDDGAGGGTARNMTRDGTEEILTDRTLESPIVFSDVDFNGGLKLLFNGRGLRAQPLAGNALVDLRNERGARFRITVSLVGNVDASSL